MESYTVVVAILGLLSLVSCHVIRDEVIPINLPEVDIPTEIYTGLSLAAQNITPVRDGSRQVDLCNCGSSTTLQTKIVGGKGASEGEIQWRVQIIIGRKNAKGEILGNGCGATILSSRWLLTAAHCFKTALPGDKVFAFAGGVSTATSSSLIESTRYILHESYQSPVIFANDIALVELERDLDFKNPKIAPACLPYQLSGETEREATVVASGWGQTTEEGQVSSSLLKATLDVIGNTECQQMHTDKTTNLQERQHWGKFGNYTDEKILTTHICTYTVDKDVCKGDSGGSLDENIDGKWYAVGVVSYGHGCARKDQAGVYTRVSEYTSWIEQNTGIDNFCKD